MFYCLCVVLDLSVTHNSWTCNWVQIPEGLSNLSLSLFFLFAWPFVELGLNCGYKLMVFVCEITSTWAYSGSTEMRCCTHIYFKNSLIRISLTSVFHQKYESQEEKAVFRIDTARTRTTSPYICYSLNARLHKHEWGVYNRSHMCIWIHTHFHLPKFYFVSLHLHSFFSFPLNFFQFCFMQITSSDLTRSSCPHPLQSSMYWLRVM